MRTVLYNLARWFHFLVFRFEHFFSVPPYRWIKGLSPQERFMYWFTVAERLRFTFPDRSSEIFHELLKELEQGDFEPHWANGRQGRVLYYLGTIAVDEEERVQRFNDCLTVMPEHYMAKEELFRMGRWKSGSEQ